MKKLKSLLNKRKRSMRFKMSCKRNSLLNRKKFQSWVKIKKSSLRNFNNLKKRKFLLKRSGFKRTSRLLLSMKVKLVKRTLNLKKYYLASRAILHNKYKNFLQRIWNKKKNSVKKKTILTTKLTPFNLQ